MVHVVPGSLIISPTPVTDLSRIKFDFKAALDFADYAFVAGFHAKYYVLYRASTLSIWRQLTVLDCNNCVNMSALAPSDLSIEYDHVPAGTYDFMVIEQGDWTGTGKNDNGRYAISNGITVEHVAGTNESLLVLTVTPSGASVSVDGGAVYSNANSYEISGKIGSSKTITVVKSGYVTKVVLVTYGDTTTRMSISLDSCFPGAYGCGTDIDETAIPKKCDGLNRNGSFDISCVMEKGNEMYLYTAIGIVGLIILASATRKR
jgi:hypothetical protein